MIDGVHAMAEAAETLADSDLRFRINAWVYFGGGDVVQVLGVTYQGGSGDWFELLQQQVAEAMPDRSDGFMFRWQIIPEAITGNSQIV